MINRFLLGSFSCLSNIPIEIVLWLSQISTKHIHIIIGTGFSTFSVFSKNMRKCWKRKRKWTNIEVRHASVFQTSCFCPSSRLGLWNGF